MNRLLTRTALVSAFSLTALAALACGSDDSDEPAAATTATSAATTAAATTAAGGTGGLKVVAREFAFSPATLTATAGQPIQVSFSNEDQGAPHSLSFQIAGAANKTCTGPCETDETLPAQAAGSYEFFCNVHSNMKGTLTVR